MKNYKTIVLSNQEVSPGYYRMQILAPGIGEKARPGQFVMFRVQLTQTPLLRRPFGIFRTGLRLADCAEEPGREFVEIFYKVVGRGTELMTQLHYGDRVELLAPLGQGFTLPASGREALLVGGGIGLVPLYMLAEHLVAAGHPTTLYMGGRSRDDILAVTEFERLGVRTCISTDDGSLGQTGLVTTACAAHLASLTGTDAVQLYACGPMPMLHAVRSLALTHGVPLQVSLEAYMACGVGACLGCVLPGEGHSSTTPAHVRCCQEGPVFPAEALDWQAMSTELGGEG